MYKAVLTLLCKCSIKCIDINQCKNYSYWFDFVTILVHKAKKAEPILI